MSHTDNGPFKKNW